jgi:hypothetical protein
LELDEAMLHFGEPSDRLDRTVSQHLQLDPEGFVEAEQANLNTSKVGIMCWYM